MIRNKKSQNKVGDLVYQVPGSYAKSGILVLENCIKTRNHIEQYPLTHKLFPSDKKMRASTVQTKRKRRRVTGKLECLDNVTYYMFDATQNKPSTRYGSTRLCGYLTDFERPVKS